MIKFEYRVYKRRRIRYIALMYDVWHKLVIQAYLLGLY